MAPMSMPIAEEQARPEHPVGEAALVTALRAGEEWAFETLVSVHGGRLLAVARRYTRSEADAQDVLQSAYLSAFRAVHQFEGTSQISTWLHRIVVNTALMRLRSKRRKPEESIEHLLPRYQEDGHHVEQFTQWSAGAEELLTRRETQAQVRAAIAQLPEGYRTVLMLRDIDEMSTQEAAAMLAMTPTAVKVRLHRARQALARILSATYGRTGVTAAASGHPTDRHAGQES